MQNPTARTNRLTHARNYIRPVLFIICLLPLAQWIWWGMHDQLGANPVEFLLHQSGGWTLRFLLIVLAITPLGKLSGWRYPVRLRRMLGLFSFFYALLHFSIYAVLDLGLDWSHVGEDIVKRPYITVGFTALLLLIPLAVTSNRRMMRKLGSKWKTLHRLVYVIGTAGVIHFLWLVKKDIREPMIYAIILAVLLLLRVEWVRRLVAFRPLRSS